MMDAGTKSFLKAGRSGGGKADGPGKGHPVGGADDQKKGRKAREPVKRPGVLATV